MCVFNGKLAISRKRWEIGPRLLWITNRKRHTPIQMSWKWLTLDDHWRSVQQQELYRVRQKSGPLISPPENDSFPKDLCFSPDVVFFFPRDISEMRGPTGVKFCTMVNTRRYFIMPVQNFGRRTPKKFQGPKTCKIWPDFGRLGSSAANISETDEDIQNRIVIPSIAIPPALGETSTVKFGPVTLEI